MEPLAIEPTANIFSVYGNPETGRLELRGSSFPESGQSQFLPILKWVEDFFGSCAKPLHLILKVDYMNSVTSKYLLVFLEKLDTYYRVGRSITVTWVYPLGDEDQYLAGKDFADEVSMPFEFHAI